MCDTLAPYQLVPSYFSSIAVVRTTIGGLGGAKFWTTRNKYIIRSAVGRSYKIINANPHENRAVGKEIYKLICFAIVNRC